MSLSNSVMGATGTGKTSFINLASGANLKVGQGLHSCTGAVELAPSFELDGRSVSLIDTPGFDDTTKSDADVLRMIAMFLAETYEHGKRLAGVIYIHRISDFRMTGISTRNFKMFRELCGESTLRNVVILTNMWGEVKPEVGEARAHELATQDIFFKPVIAKGAQFLRHDNTRAAALSVIRRILQNHPMALQIQRELVDEGKDMAQTAAGAQLNKEMMEQIEKHRKEIKAVREEMKEAIRVKDEEARRELEAEANKLQAEMMRVQNESQKLATDYRKEKERLENRMQEMSEASRREQERASAEHNRQLSGLRDQLSQTSAKADKQKSELESQIQSLRMANRGGGGGGGGFFTPIGRALDRVFRF
ncbi:hypothetical protein JR316_0005793 [Psilocybe cubensis]|uniref:G domain-containing protein n=2 Tax=Psilocybe cubensis TaxID=181762 RepID=A0A8H7XYE8_PSICU|nr:hypothetical protein JR316_0005793 [Psilocybe cubensis]KAH9481271.1 hypothetical protein JR316_0005793 [Psilocybe cubensis]